MIEKLAELIWKILEPRIDELLERAYVKGSEDIIRRFAYVYDTVAKTAREDAYVEAGAIEIDDLDEELSKTIFEELEDE